MRYLILRTFDFVKVIFHTNWSNFDNQDIDNWVTTVKGAILEDSAKLQQKTEVLKKALHRVQTLPENTLREKLRHGALADNIVNKVLKMAGALTNGIKLLDVEDCIPTGAEAMEKIVLYCKVIVATFYFSRIFAFSRLINLMVE